ncbi:MAG: septal ring lytic transglycosylase RlpA family protein [Burkholderiaceae bacterium]|nr:septal ring lytic transglycosylase RlpA family protein [Burkholderiaceae bacterium]
MSSARRLRAAATAAVATAAFAFLAATSPVPACAAPVAPSASRQAARESDATSFAPDWHQQGRISYYGKRFDSRPTASGEPFDPESMTMAHPTLPLGSIVRVKNLRNGRSVELRVNDRGPYEKGRIADVSRAAARKLGMLRRGVTRARIELLRAGDDPD